MRTDVMWKPPKLRRAGGVLLHPTSLPTPFGIGDLGPSALAFVDELKRAQVAWWQVLPLGPTGYGDSPYASFSSFAGNTHLISPVGLAEDGLLQPSDLAAPPFPVDRVDFGRVIPFKNDLLEKAWQRYQNQPPPGLRAELAKFLEEHAAWLSDYALFRALKEHFPGKGMLDWPEPVLRRERTSLDEARRELRARLDFYAFGQFLFYRQWHRLKSHAHDRGVRLLGDVPIFVAADSADVWAHPELFLLDARRQPTHVAGVPPDYFSVTGQLWGNPLYDWEEHSRTGFAWWIQRLQAALDQVDLVRLDHFRGFEAAWHVPAGAKTAEVGEWLPGPGLSFFRAVQEALGELPLVAEDLGEITPPVRVMLAELGLPGMRILQFAFDSDADNPFLPHHHVANTVVYTGTHDNDTTRGWYRQAEEGSKEYLKKYIGRAALGDHHAVWELIRLAWSSVAVLSVVPLQDILELGTSARMNLPGQGHGNWDWRLHPEAPLRAAFDRLAEFSHLYARCPPAPPKAPEEAPQAAGHPENSNGAPQS